MGSNEIISHLFRSGSGRLGILILFVMVSVSIFVLATFPRNFGSQIWSDPSQWADYPKAAPPQWVNLISEESRPKHIVLKMSQPGSENIYGGSRTNQYSAEFVHSSNEPPSFLSISFSEIQFHTRAPQIRISLLRPDNKEIVLFRHIVRGPRAGETSPFSRYSESDYRTLLTSDKIVLNNVETFFKTSFKDFRGKAFNPDIARHAIFGTPIFEDSLNQTEFTPLTGRYEINIQVISDPRDDIGPMQFVYGGSVYGFMGTDAQGRDLLKGLLFGLPIALLIGVGAALLTALIGTTLGIASGYIGGWVDICIQRGADIVANIPVLPLLIFLIFIIGSKLYLIILVLVAFSWPSLAILIRSMVLQTRSSQLVEMAITLGASPTRIMTRYIFPQTAPFVFAQLVFLIPSAILAEAALSFLGLGDASIPTWGQILEQGFRSGGIYVGYWWWVLPPGLLIVTTAMTFILLALSMEQVTNPRLRKRPLQ
ncbi:MAG: ABC transporter permease [SAR202 cluster bacterium]|nr:ABC transporter permease [SAR202 cluster bacterium]|tara:strand:+ start:3529 stop:4974 length:1446 start_codon:yes stop_codon:yes gene_type:complete